ncbi:Replication factor C subunit 5-like, partial [Homarus americanus]
VEKYRPQTLQDLISHEDIISTIKRFIDEDHLPHLLFYGPPGTGKTSTILACARKLYSPKEFNSMVLELNASDDRGIGVVRQQILNFASTLIEKFTDNVRFCLICNYLSKIIPAIQSRCTRFRFGPLASDQILPRLNYVIDRENVTVSEDGRKALLSLSGGDMRRVLNILQSTAMAFKEVTEDNVYTCVGHPLRSDITNIINWMLNEPFDIAYKTTDVNTLKITKGFALQDILTELHAYVHRIDFPVEVRVYLVEQLSDVEVRLCAGASEKLQLSSVLAAFTRAKHMVAAEASTY